jgi:hypothetical protein
MKNFIYSLLPKQHFLLLLFCCIPFIRGMEPAEISLQPQKDDAPRNTTPDKVFKIFDPELLAKAGIPIGTAVPKDILITPDGNGALIGEPGRVRYINFSNLFESQPHILIEHRCRKFWPIFAVAQMKDGRLVVVSFVNYKDRENNKRVSECIVCYNTFAFPPRSNAHDVFEKSIYEKKNFDWPVQAVALHCAGTVVVIAHGEYLEAFNLITWKSKTSKFWPKNPSGLVIVDLSVKCKGENVAAVDSRGVVDFKMLAVEEKDIEFNHLRDVHPGNESPILKICFLETTDLLYVTSEGTVKIVNTSDWLENSHGNVKSLTFSHADSREKAAVDQNALPATIHWTKKKITHDTGIKIYRDNGTEREEFNLKLGNMPATYPYITKMGQNATGSTHILAAVLRDSRVAALCTDGNMKIWSLPKTHKVPTENDVLGMSMRMGRRRSTSSPSLVPAFKEIKKSKRSSLFHRITSAKDLKKTGADTVPGSPGNKKREEERSASVSPKNSPHSKRASGVQMSPHAKSDDYQLRLREDISNNLMGWEKDTQ